MAPKRTKKKVVGTLVKTTKKVVEEKVNVSVEGNGEEVEETEAVLPPSKEKRVAKVVKEKLTVSVEEEEEEEAANEEEGEEIESELPSRGDDGKKKKGFGSEEEKKKKKKEEVGGEKSKSKKKKKRGSRNATAGEVSGNYKRYVYMVLKQVHPELGVSSMAMAVIDAMMRDMFERIAGEAARLSKHAQKVTLSSRDIQSAVQLVLPGELGKHAVAEGTKAIRNYVTAG